MAGTIELADSLIKASAPNVMMHRGDAIDADTIRTPGTYVTQSNTLNVPAGFNNGVMEVMVRPPSEVFQRVTAWTGDKMAVRTGGASSWSAWKIYRPAQSE